MSTHSALKLLLAISGRWCTRDATNVRRLEVKHLLPLSYRQSPITCPAQGVYLKFRSIDGDVTLDNEARLIVVDGSREVFLRSESLAADLQRRNLDDMVLYVLLEQVQEIVRATVHISATQCLDDLAGERPELRIPAYDLPPVAVTTIEPSLAIDGMDADSIFEVLVAWIDRADAELFSLYTDKFLKAPHIVVPLLSHLASLSAEENLRFPVQLKRLADQFRTILASRQCALTIHKLARTHLETWADAERKRFTFVDGGVAKIAGLPGTEPTALRVGLYSVRPGDESLNSREQWSLHPFVVGDIIDKATSVPMAEHDQIDLRRLGEAARYTLEPLVAWRFVVAHPDVSTVFLHGPLINQFVQYDEGEPHFIPFLRNDFLKSVPISQRDVEDVLRDIPRSPNGVPMWRQFMAIYGYVMTEVFRLTVPFVGVVERSAGTWLAEAVLSSAVEARLLLPAYKNKVMALLSRYNISDDFLFGCVLEEGEYISPVTIPKNSSRRARDKWKPVVDQYPQPFATVLKTTEVSFPFRVEMNAAAKQDEHRIMRLLYHTARLLPRYAFPVGLDIVDKYAKVPDWLSRNVSARLAAVVLNRAMAEGDPRLVAQIRQLLAHTPRDFFYRPTT
jgi:hypothetical protein